MRDALAGSAGERVEPVENEPVDHQALADEPLAIAGGLFAGNADFGKPLLPRHRLDPGDKRAKLAFQFGERNQEVGPEGNKHIAVIVARTQSRAAEKAEGLDDQPKPEPLVSAKRQQRAAAR